MTDDSDVPFRVLVFSKTAAFRHESIPDGVAALQRLGKEHGFGLDATEDADAFTDDNLARYAAVVWLSTSGTVLDGDQRGSFQRYIRGGGGYVGIHGAADTEYEWPWYGGLVGAWFDDHPQIQPAAVDVVDRGHQSTAHLPERWERTDEWYNYRTNPRPHVRVLATVDESSYSGGTMRGDHPITWCQDYDGGRAWYTGCGHTAESFSEAPFVAHLLGGILSVAAPTPPGGAV